MEEEFIGQQGGCLCWLWRINSGSDNKGSDGAGGGGGVQGEGEDVTPTKHNGRRGEQPTTLVMHTMAGRNLDVRELMNCIL